MSSSKEQIALLHQFIDMCKKNPDILHDPNFKFYREYLESLGATIPPKSTKQSKTESKQNDGPTANAPPPSPPHVEEPEEEEEPLELDNSGVIEPETDAALPMGDPEKLPTDEEIELANDKRDEAMREFSEGNIENAVKLFTEAIELNPGSALLHAKRANALLKLQKPVNAIHDCDKAIEINADSAQAYKFRGRAKRLLGKWVEAYHDLAMACKLDYDDTANEWLKEVEPNAKKLIEHNRKKERTAEQKEIDAKRERVRRAQEANRKAEEERRKQHPQDDGDDGDEMGGMPAGFAELFNNPEVVALLKDPETMTAYMDIMQNPNNIAKHLTNPKVMKLLELMQKKAGFGAAKGGSGGEEMPNDVEMDTETPSKQSSSSTGGGPKIPEPDLD